MVGIEESLLDSFAAADCAVIPKEHHLRSKKKILLLFQLKHQSIFDNTLENDMLEVQTN